MSKVPLLSALLFLIFAPIFGQELIDDRQITINSPADIVAKRQELIQQVWGTKTIPIDKLPRLPVIQNDRSPIPGLADLERVDTLIIEMESGVKSYAHHFIPRLRNDRLVILHSGHFATFNDSDIPADEGFGMRRTIEGLLGDGYSVLAIYMPRNVEFETSISIDDDGGLAAHNALFEDPAYKPKSGGPLKYFLEPITACLNYLSSRSTVDNFPVYKDYSMVGFSGGGWATTVYAALDTRIRISVSIAGSMPLYLRSGATVGDAEQTVPEFYSTAGYPDLYVMGSNGRGRKQIQILNRNDWCCFSQVHHNPKMSGGLSFDESVRLYESKVRQTLIALGNSDLFSVEIDEAAPGHNVTWDAIFDTVLPELNEGRRYVATATGDEAIARGANGMPAVFVNGIWSPTKLAPMIGTPAILRGAVSIYDMFYRTSNNQLVYVSRPPLIWSRPNLLMSDVIADPAAASRGPGSFDVVVLGKDYKLYHINRTGTETRIEPISDQVKGLGQPTLIASAPDQLDVFYKSWNRRLYHGRKMGNGPWIVQEAGGRMIDFPTAVRLNDGSFRAFLRGQDGGLWESRLEVGSDTKWSSWVSLSSKTGSGAIQGSPSAALVKGMATVYARGTSSNIRIFSLGQNWTASEQAGTYVGSPTASPRGIFVRDTDGSLNYSNGSTWTELGGSLD